MFIYNFYWNLGLGIFVLGDRFVDGLGLIWGF